MLSSSVNQRVARGQLFICDQNRMLVCLLAFFFIMCAGREDVGSVPPHGKRRDKIHTLGEGNLRRRRWASEELLQRFEGVVRQLSVNTSDLTADLFRHSKTVMCLDI